MTPSARLVLSATLFLGTLPAPASHKYAAPPPEFFQANLNDQPDIIGVGDTLIIRFYYNPELNKTVKVRPDGKISLDLFQGVQAAGKTPEILHDQLVSMYSKEFLNPEITVDLDSSATTSVYVTGEVLLPGSKPLTGGMTVAMALAMSQVSQKSAGTKSVFLIRATAASTFSLYKLDVSFPGGSGLNLPVRRGDVLFVPRKAIVKADDFIDLYVRQLLPATPSANTTVLFTPGTPTVATATASSH